MAIDKQPSSKNGTTRVTLRIPAEAGAATAQVLGDFNDWTPTDMGPSDDGGYELALDLEKGRSYRFRYLLDNRRWENDWQADSYVPNEYGGDDSLIDLTTNGGPASAADARPEPAKRPTRRPQTPASP